MKKVRVRLFAAARDALGGDEVLAQISLEGTVADLRRHLEDAYPGAAGFLAHCRVAVDRDFAAEDDVIPERTEVALIPPVSGG
ncbi:MAG: MoaD/ThiS family protein [Planctomycetota bacterium]